MNPARTASHPLLRYLMAPVLRVLCMLAGPEARSTPAASAFEGQVKAGYLYKFAGYVAWPGASFTRPAAPRLIAVAGNFGLASQLENIVVARMLAVAHRVEGAT